MYFPSTANLKYFLQLRQPNNDGNYFYIYTIINNKNSKHEIIFYF